MNPSASLLPRLPSAALAAFAVCSALHLAAVAADTGLPASVTKALLMPLLAAWLLARGGPRPVVAGLLLSTGGDIALEFEGTGPFVTGMAFFAAAHVCYVVFFLRGGAVAGLRRQWIVPVAYGVVWAAMVVALWPGLGALRIPVALYSLLLTATAVTSAGYGLRAGIGGCLFLVSDALIALGLAGLPRPPVPGLWVMATYIAAQYLIASGVRAAGGGTEP
ncbi:lysoplasmalogenase [Planomonospora corallina]|uniref:Lysoplasmalogenase n=1 Tax=Planomonospora corallina TaxID=1806052 RepID=A0ABV8I2W9_9ACTN